MTILNIHTKQLLEGIEKIKKAVSESTFEELCADKNNLFTNICHEDGTLFDFDYDNFSGTINLIENGKAELCPTFSYWTASGTHLFEFEVYNNRIIPTYICGSATEFDIYFID